MEYYVPCPCEGKESPCFSCCETGKIGPLSYYEYKAFYENLKNQPKFTLSHRTDKSIQEF